MTGDRRLRGLAWMLGMGIGCDPVSAPSATDEEPTAQATAATDAHDHGGALEEAGADDTATDKDDRVAVEPDVVTPSPATDLARPGAPGAPIPVEPPPSLAAPTEHRRATRAMMVYVEPRFGTPFRGKIPDGATFVVYETVPASLGDDECRRSGWGRIDAAAYVCLRYSEPVEAEPAVLPARLPDGLAPFFYGRRPGKEGSPNRPEVPVYRSRQAMLAGAAPERFLEVEHDYTFVERRRTRDGAMLTTPDRRVVRERDIRRLAPSKFAGRDLRARPLSAGTTMAWSVQWPHAVIREEPDPEAAEKSRIALHVEALATGETRTAAGETWVAIIEPAQGWALLDHVRYWVDHEPSADVRDDELWIDVDLDQQMLALRRGATVEFLTLISSGTPKHPTPLGLYRIEGKWAYADMRSRAGDEEEYYVEGVPWVQYFKGRYALHGTFWHNRFGRRTSHGCINLSAHDARWVYERTWPAPKPGWLVINEHAQEPGTLLRIRKGAHDPPDRREALKTRG